MCTSLRAHPAGRSGTKGQIRDNKKGVIILPFLRISKIAAARSLIQTSSMGERGGLVTFSFHTNKKFPSGTATCLPSMVQITKMKVISQTQDINTKVPDSTLCKVLFGV